VIEEWVPVPGSPGYEASTMGRVRSIDRLITNRLGVVRQWRGRVLIPRVDDEGYARVRLGAVPERPVHQVILETFVGPRPPGKVGCHGPGGSLDNRPENLRWDTQSANIRDSVREGTHYRAQFTVCPWQHLLIWPNLRAKPWRERRHRGCLACARARAVLRGQPEQVIRADADRRYREIMTAA
jgi:hypothetical protein